MQLHELLLQERDAQVCLFFQMFLYFDFVDYVFRYSGELLLSCFLVVFVHALSSLVATILEHDESTMPLPIPCLHSARAGHEPEGLRQGNRNTLDSLPEESQRCFDRASGALSRWQRCLVGAMKSFVAG